MDYFFLGKKNYFGGVFGHYPQNVVFPKNRARQIVTLVAP